MNLLRSDDYRSRIPMRMVHDFSLPRLRGRAVVGLA